jgi:hypothetical protein
VLLAQHPPVHRAQRLIAPAMRRTASAAASARRGMPQAIEVHGLQGGRASSSLGLGYGQGALFYLDWNNKK